MDYFSSSSRFPFPAVACPVKKPWLGRQNLSEVTQRWQHLAQELLPQTGAGCRSRLCKTDGKPQHCGHRTGDQHQGLKSAQEAVLCEETKRWYVVRFCEVLARISHTEEIFAKPKATKIFLLGFLFCF